MKFIRYRYHDDVATGLLDGETVRVVHGNLFDEWHQGETMAPLSRVQLLAPVLPGKVVCVGRNYAAHAAEHDADVPEEPLLFLKPPSAIIGPDAPIKRPALSKQVEHEAELAVVIGTRCRHVAVEDAWDVVFGYMCGNDVTARDLQRADGQWTRGKGFDTFCPLGPAIETKFNPDEVDIVCRVNGEVRQHANTRDMIFSIPDLITAITAVMTLEPGDIVMTGTPEGVGPLYAGDSVEVEIEGLGVLQNTVRNE